MSERVISPKAPDAMPALEILDERAASDQPSWEGARWNTLQFVEHAMHSISRHDPVTGAPMPRRLHLCLEDLERLLATGERPLPQDELLALATYCRVSLDHVLAHPRERIVRAHEQRAIASNPELDATSLQWIARQPGLTVRQKLSGKHSVLAVRRQMSVNTHENQVACLVMKQLAAQIEARLRYVETYDPDSAGREALENMLRTCTRALRHSPLGLVPPPARVGPNNVLLNDRHYSRIWRTWKRLRAMEARYRDRWYGIDREFRHLVFWAGIAALRKAGALVLDELVLAERGHLQAARRDRSRWDEVSVDMLLPQGFSGGTKGRPGWVRLAMAPNGIQVKRAWIDPAGSLTPRDERILVVEVDPEVELSPRAGLPLRAPGKDPICADLDGLRVLCRLLVLAVCRNEPVFERAPEPEARLATEELLGIDLDQSTALVAGEEKLWAMGTPTHAAWLPYADGTLTGEWQITAPGALDLLDPALRVSRIRDALDRERQEAGAAMQPILEALAAEIRPAPGARLVYTVPDAVNDFAQRPLRAAVGRNFGRAYPLRRSVAIALGWQARMQTHFQEGRLRDQDVVVILDCEARSTVPSVLVARRDETLRALRPETGGIYWECRPLPELDQSGADLAAENLYEPYARHLIGGAQGETPLAAEDFERAVRRLVDVGLAETLAMPDAVQWVRVGERWLRLEHDAAEWGRLCGLWCESLLEVLKDWIGGGGVGEVLATLPKRTSGYVLLVGAPFFSAASGEGEVSAFEALKGGLAKLFKPRFERLSLTRLNPADGLLARGARECMNRLACELPAWKDWLPDLYLEVVKDGLYDELCLMQERLLEPRLGEERPCDVDATATLGAGARYYTFPLVTGKQNRRILSVDVRLEHPSFPLAQDLPVTLSLSYRYGHENSYKLIVRPSDPKDAPFDQLVASWVQATTDMAQADNRVPLFPARPDSPPDVVRVWINNAEYAIAKFEMDCRAAVVDGELSPGWILRAGNELYANGRDCNRLGLLAQRDAVVREKMRGWLERDFGAWLHALAGLQPTGPGGIKVELTREAYKTPEEALLWLSNFAAVGPEAAMAQVCSHLAACQSFAELDSIHMVTFFRMLRASADPRLRATLHHLLTLDLVPDGKPIVFQRFLEGIADLAWRQEDFLLGLCLANRFVAETLREGVGRHLRRLLRSLSAFEATREIPQNIKYSVDQFQACCEVLLALLRLRTTPFGAGLEASSPEMAQFAKVIRRLDCLFAKMEDQIAAMPPTIKKPHVTVRSRILRFDVPQPPELHRVSRLAFVLNCYLLGSETVSLIKMSGAE